MKTTEYTDKETTPAPCENCVSEKDCSEQDYYYCEASDWSNFVEVKK